MKKTVSIRFPSTLYKMLTDIAYKEERSLNKQVIHMLYRSAFKYTKGGSSEHTNDTGKNREA